MKPITAHSRLKKDGSLSTSITLNPGDDYSPTIPVVIVPVADWAARNAVIDAAHVVALASGLGLPPERAIDALREALRGIE